ncbi:EutN/CcmL family microcompartment protein [Clostridium frigidicarnis]|uniref:Ethanolamine utilization protein EutN n=1 Tax=Clostridium frigidicarnis TaxID=84698 RepID=A0A1I0XDF3_9CLOT|nr:EutN/CcmL family microcompartment protein [Clostridium frigidicarnis]SFA99021.1 ethanolamine utilization protein EutN [Clostridium frigidicarnis]
MLIGKVVGKLWATRKDEKLNGIKFLIVRLMKNSVEESESIYVAADTVGAGTGDLVMITRGGSARSSLGLKDVPIDSTIVGIIDSMEIDDA